ncbi:MAG: 3-phosphoshikimate 1-carboxyvinyltransferase [Bdellovibrionaceae bacterium]|nr:3-phosphoshikimate 1-carboxyvinyltransferase [Pseudobdellovibrionaceae bacterium]
MNRCLTVASYADHLQILGQSSCEDVVKMRSAIDSLKRGEDVDCGSAGTVFRFLAFRASRIPGRHRLTGTSRLLSRPQETLIEILAQLGVRAHFEAGGFTIESEGWRDPQKPLLIDRSKSSQFATGVLLNSWDLDFPLSLQWKNENDAVSEGYWQMTVAVASALGMTVEKVSEGVRVPARSIVKGGRHWVEIDLSSAFAVAAIATVSGQAAFDNFPNAAECLQPDREFVRILDRMGARIRESERTLSVSQATELRPIEWSLRDCPDLFPVLAVLCAFAEGTSTLFGAPHLAYKESNRITKTAELIGLLGRRCEPTSEGMIIHGSSAPAPASGAAPVEFDPDQDHRLAFAAAVARAADFQIHILHPEVVNKSFPEFWQVAAGRL